MQKSTRSRRTPAAKPAAAKQTRAQSAPVQKADPVPKTNSAPKTTPQAPVAQRAAVNSDAMTAFANAMQAYSNGIVAYNGEMMSFLNSRLQHDADLGQALSHCHTWSDAMQVQQDWAQQTLQEYVAHAGRMTEMASNLAKDGLEPVYQTAGHLMTQLHKTGDSD